MSVYGLSLDLVTVLEFSIDGSTFFSTAGSIIRMYTLEA